MRHTLREAWSGLRRNLTMTFAVIITMWVSLTLFGGGLLGAQQVELAKGRWYDKIEISVFLCVKASSGRNCEPGQDATDAQKQAIRTALETNSEVESVYYESKADTWEDFKRVYKDSPVLADMSVDLMQDSFRVKLKDPEQYEGVVSAIAGLPGVQAVQDLRQYLNPLFQWLNIAKWATIGLSLWLLLAAALQIATTIKMAAFSRRRELGIMRLVGASNWYIMLPFLIESLVAALVGAALACGSLAAIEKFLIIDRAQPSLKSIEWIGWSHVGLAMLGVVAVGVVLSIVPTVIATRKYLRV